MFRRALLAAAVISYLICVLILSGGLKDNVEANPPQKLQSPNVKIHVLNNENLHKKCLINNNVAGVNKSEMLKTLLNSTSIRLLIKQLKNVDFDDFYTKNTTSNRYEKPEIVGVNSTVTRGRRTVVTDVTDTNIQESTTILIETINNKELLKYSNEKPNLKNVITFWQALVKRKNIETDSKEKAFNDTKKSNVPKIPTQIKVDKLQAVVNNYIENRDRIEGGYLKHMLPKFITEERISPDKTSTTPSTSQVVTDDDTDIFKYILDSRDKESLESHNINAHLSKYSYEFKYSNIKYGNKILKQKNNFSDDAKPKNTFIENIEESNDAMRLNIKNNPKYNTNRFIDMRAIKEFNAPDITSVNHYEDFKPHDTRQVFKTKYEDNSQELGDIHNTKHNKNFEFKRHRDEKSTSTLPPDLIKQIAEDVKALILKDLHKNTSTLPTLTTLKGTTESTTTNSLEKSFEKPHILKKILEILEKYKNIEQSTIVYQTEANLYIKTPKAMYPVVPQSENKAISENNLPYLNPYYPYKSAKGPKPFVPVRNLSPSISSIDRTKNFKSTPIMLQTNLLEIPPLGVGVLNPLPLVKHDVIVRHPIRQKQRNVISRNARPKDKKSTVTNPERIRNAKRIKNFKHNKHKSDKIEHKVTDNKEIVNRYDDKNMKKLNPNGYSNYQIRTENNMKRLHEKLEHFHSKPNKKENTGDCCKDEIFTEEQHSFNDMKMRDETSFKNLLKTQERVTNMLALMLARTKDQPLSVETT